MTASQREPKTRRGRATRRKLLDAAAQEFGSKGYFATAVTDITGRAGIAQGTFYIYFESKEAVFRALVLDMGRQLRQELSEAVAGAPDRIAAERQGMAYFIQFVRNHPHLYRIVMEAQFVDPPAFREYFTGFAEAYAINLARAAERGEVRSGPTEERAWALLGMSLFLGLRYGIWETERPAGEIADAVMEMVACGLLPDGGREEGR
ncbi:MAG: TetR/AcrR family transcriptional regulator [Gammaproteobacteria bacterium]